MGIVVISSGETTNNRLKKLVSTANKSSITIVGPAGCGKTTNAEKLAKHFGLSVVLDDWGLWWCPKIKLPSKGVLILTTDEHVCGCHVVSYEDAIKQAGIKGK